MKSTKIISLSVLIFSKFAIAADVSLAPSVVIATSGTETEYSRFINILNNSFVYSSVTNKILNGSGNKSVLPVKQAPLYERILDQLSFFDLYFQKSLSVSGINNLNLDLHFLPTQNTTQGSLNILESTKYNINVLSDTLRSVVNPVIQYKKSEELYSVASLQAIRNSQISALNLRTAMHIATAPTAASNPSQWLLTSFSPISMGSQLKITESEKFIITSFLFPAYDYLTIFKAYFNNIKNVNTNVIRVEFIKTMNNPHLLDMAISFGNLTEKNPTSIYSMDVDLLNRSSKTQINNNTNLSLSTNSDFDLSKYLNLNASTNEKLKEIIKAIDIFDIKLVFHKVYFELNRLPIHDPSLAYLSNEKNINNLNLFLNENVGFDIKNLRFNPNKSVYNVVFALKPEFKAKLESSAWWTSAQDTIQSQLIKLLCSENKKAQGETSNCQFSMSDFNNKISVAFNNDLIKTYLSGVNFQISSHLKQSEKVMSDALHNASLKLLTVFNDNLQDTKKPN